MMTELERLCNKALDKLARAEKLIFGIRANDGARTICAAWLRNECQHLNSLGLVLCIPVDDIFAELQALDTDAASGPREEMAR